MHELLDGWFQFNVGDGAVYAVFGLAFVILGIALLVAIFTVLGIVMRKINEAKRPPAESIVPEHPVTAGAAPDDIPPEVVAAIVGALTAYYEEEKVTCDFVVRRIKRI